MICSQCGASFEVCNNLSGPKLYSFCSSDCLVDFVRRQKAVVPDCSIDGLIDQGLVYANQQYSIDIFDESAYYSSRLATYFRSAFEAAVAEALVIYYKEDVCYEPYEILLPSRTKRRVYIPDFFLPRYGIFLEVKGMWFNGGKRKFLQAVSLLGADRMLLVPAYLRDDFVGKIK